MHRPLPSLAGLTASAHVVSLPMRVKFRGVTERETLLLRGPAGWAEFGPFPEYDDGEAARWLAAAVEAGWDGFPPARRNTIPVNATVPAVEAERVAGVLAGFDGIAAVKVKVAERGQSLADDVARVEAVRRILPSAAVRVDANGGWSVDEALTGLDALAEFDLEYAEQPVKSIEAMGRVRAELRRRGVPVLIAADESVRKEEDPLLVSRSGAADLIVVKVAPLGGVRNALRIVSDAGLPAVVSSALDSSVGIRAGVALAAALPELPYACGLGTVSLMNGDVTDDPLKPAGGALSVRDVAVSDELLERYAATGQRRAWWLERLERVHGVLERLT